MSLSDESLIQMADKQAEQYYKKSGIPLTEERKAIIHKANLENLPKLRQLAEMATKFILDSQNK